MRQTKFRDFSNLKIGQRVALCNYGASYNIGIIKSITTRCNEQKDTYLAITIENDSYFDAYKRSHGIIKLTGYSSVSEYYERPVYTIEQLNEKEVLSL